MGTVHRFHPDENDPTGAVLYDGCERCDEHAKHPLMGLDAANLTRLVDLRNARTVNDAAAYAILERVRADAHYLERTVARFRTGAG